eukprot:TRINITY_DN10740_c0_g1_i1.p1 TRINITY_DN10740_c0_g1~~TRINITY_DN10740_c0_g1_i1.p1  ORF type:complete len:1661 (-),score=520.05 TRINITY_DN10740_c0_g1_i1:41-4441(-)
MDVPIRGAQEHRPTQAHIVARRKELTDQFLSHERLVGTKCPHCGHTQPRLNRLGEKLFVMQHEEGSRKNSKMLYLAQEARSLLKKVWSDAFQHTLLTFIFGSVPVQRGNRTSSHRMFFIKHIPVSPPRFRPSRGDPVTGGVSPHMDTRLYQKILMTIDELRSFKDLDDTEKFLVSVTQLQVAVRDLHEADPKRPGDLRGIVNILEKKEGLFRSNLMGKRVNFAARTVLSPDVFLQANEIGIPIYFAKKLCYPEPVTPRNFDKMKQAVMNGSNVHPGANFVIMGHKVYILDRCSEEERAALAKNLLATDTIVYRHALAGDVALCNRQPTLHKPSIMGHYIKLLKTEKTLRMHYTNCATYNADFDGDEVNVHLPQDDIARAEAMEIVNTDHQYVVPKDGSPVRGLIQDHVGTGVLLTKKDTFFEREEFQQLVYSACLELNMDHPLEMPHPAIVKPPRWTGKQVVGCVLKQATYGRPHMNCVAKSKLSNLWGGHTEEDTVIFHDSELLTGVLDKNAFGASAFGMVHACQELYGGRTANQILSLLGRLFTLYLQTVGFTCGIDDMILEQVTDEKRNKTLSQVEDMGLAAASKFSGVASETQTPELHEKMAELLREEAGVAQLDSLVKGAMLGVNSDVTNMSIPFGIQKKFPANNMSLMTSSGAKGGLVNFSQISCLLGQQELEGKRPPTMITGRTLPCFQPYETHPRAGGFISQRFLTGVNPQEFYFHCMAGREGLIDTAVKTSRSGYLQRCIIKAMEGLQVAYDHTVREADGSIIQFYYGEDGIDVAKNKYLDRFEFHALNWRHLLRYRTPSSAKQAGSQGAPAVADFQESQDARTQSDEPVMSYLDPHQYPGSVSEKFHGDLVKFMDSPVFQKMIAEGTCGVTRPEFHELMCNKYARSMAHPGESVGVLAGQSIGEPSTQMTLNTFHLAGRGDVNVTLGIPRLREILMTGAKQIGTPSLTVPLRAGIASEEKAKLYGTLLSELKMEKLLHSLQVEDLQADYEDVHLSVSVTLLPESELRKHRLTYDLVSALFTLKGDLVIELDKNIHAKLKHMERKGVVSFATTSSKKQGGIDQDEPEDNDEEAETITEGPEDVDGTDATKNRDRSYGDDDEDSRIVEEPLGEGEDLQYEVQRNEEDDEEEGEDTSEVEISKKKSDKNYKFMFVEKASFSNGVGKIIISLKSASDQFPIVAVIQKFMENYHIRKTPELSRAVPVETEVAGKKQWGLQTEGINFVSFWKRQDLFDVDNIKCNSIYDVLKNYGVEAAHASIGNELNSVFKAYGIGVDRRHLSLIGDWMTFHGGFRAMNRREMQHSHPPLLKMSFESTGQFLSTAVAFGESDDMKTPSASIALGIAMRNGTGICQTRIPLKQPKAWESWRQSQTQAYLAAQEEQREAMQQAEDRVLRIRKERQQQSKPQPKAKTTKSPAKTTKTVKPKSSAGATPAAPKVAGPKVAGPKVVKKTATPKAKK